MMTRTTIVAAIAVLTVPLTSGFSSADPGPLDGCGIPPGSERCEVWSAKPAGTTFADVAVSRSDGRVYAAGHSASALFTAAFDPSGTLRWSSTRDAASGRAIDVTPDGSTVLVAGNQAPGDFLTVAYDASTGVERWARSYDLAGLGDSLNAMTLSADGSKVFLTGYSDCPAGSLCMDASTVAYDVATGAELWRARYDGPGNAWDIPMAVTTVIAPTPDGPMERVVITSRSNVQGTANEQTDVATVAYDADTGAQVWVDFFNGPSNSREYPYAIAASPDGSRVYVAAESSVPFNGFDYATIAIDATTGVKVWNSLYHGGYGDDRALGVAVSPGGDTIVITGFTPNQQGIHGAVDRSATTVAYSRDGTQLWVAKDNRPGGQAGSSVTVSPDGGSVIVAGLTVGQAFGGGIDMQGVGGTGGPRYLVLSGFLTISYRIDTGARSWIARYPDSGSARAVAVSPDSSRAYVAGGGSNAVLLAYED